MSKHENQKGIATILIVLVVGLVMSVAVLDTASYVRQNQAQNVAAVTQTQAQMNSWNGAEIVRQYLQKLNSTQIKALTDAYKNSQEVALKFEDPQSVVPITAKLTNMTFSGATLETATFKLQSQQYKDTKAQAFATLDVVYSLGVPAAAPPPPPTVLSYNKNLALGGSIEVLKDSQDENAYQVNVEGDIAGEHFRVTGMDVLVSTGSVALGSDSSFKELIAQCDVSIGGSVNITNIYAGRNACVGGGNGSGSGSMIVANGSVDFGANNAGDIFAHASKASVPGCAAAGSSGGNGKANTCPAPSVIGVNLSGGYTSAGLVRTKGDVVFNNGSIQRVEAEKKLNVTSSGSIAAGSASAVVKPSWNDSVKVQKIPGNKVAALPTVKSPAIQHSTFNAYSKNPNDPDDADLPPEEDVRGNANYLFTIENGYKKVTVKNVNGIADGTYFLGKYPDGNFDYLCTAVKGDKNDPDCISPSVTSAKKIGAGYSNWNTLISYNNGTWVLNGNSMVPGIAWFEGSLEVGNGTYYNTFIATKNISTSGSHVTYAPNYAGYDGKGSGRTYAPTGVCANSYFPGLYPKQFCQSGEFVPSPFGDFAFMAGSWPESGTVSKISSNYQGGNITLGSNAKVYGSVKAGNEFASGGSTLIHGYASALGMGMATNSTLGGSTTFDLRNLPPTFKPGGLSISTPPGGGNGPAAPIKVKWARYR